MSWFIEALQTNPTAHAIAIISLVCVAGMSLGSLKVRGLKLGTAGVLFAAILVGHFGKPIQHQTLEFVKEFGLILFVFCIGLQIGPGFFSSLRQSGLKMNLMAIAIVLLGTVTVALFGSLQGLDGAAMLGIFSGATTNTPSLGAAQQTLSSFPETSVDRAALPALAYAVTYPAGIVGIIASLLLIKGSCQINVVEEAKRHDSQQKQGLQPIERRTLVVENANLQGRTISEVPALRESAVVVSRIRHAGTQDVTMATRDTKLHVDDSILVVGTRHGLDQFQCVVGRASDENLISTVGSITNRRVVVTNVSVLGKSLDELNFELMGGLIVTRVTRAGVEITAVPALRLQFGDVLQVVGPTNAIDSAASRLGDSVQALNETHFVPLFTGIFLGIMLGMLPVAFPGLPQPLRLGLAGGPLIAAIILGRFGRIGRLVWHMPRSANLAFREFGIALFFAAVGLLAGPTFFSAAFSRVGLQWLVTGMFVTTLPLIAVGIFARKKLNMNFVEISGLLAGSMTDPPALAFASNICHSESPAVAYATVYPLTMLLRIMVAQLLAVILCG